jgi:NADPH-dependent 2,4-dienoyl-CoA reductase/sulfur reductase-like enzyme
MAQTDPLSNGSPATVVTDLLIVGTGPAGASLACFLASHGKHTLV